MHCESAEHAIEGADVHDDDLAFTQGKCQVLVDRFLVDEYLAVVQLMNFLLEYVGVKRPNVLNILDLDELHARNALFSQCFHALTVPDVTRLLHLFEESSLLHSLVDAQNR